MRVPGQQIDVTLPSNAVRMLIAQPFLEFQDPVQEPFALTPVSVRRLEDAVDNTFVKVAAYHPRFVLFPEFSVPGLAGVQRIAQHLALKRHPSPACRRRGRIRFVEDGVHVAVRPGGYCTHRSGKRPTKGAAG